MWGPMPEFDVNEKDGIYYGGGYWNELDAVRRMFNQRISGRAVGPWFHDFSVGRSGPFRRALARASSTSSGRPCSSRADSKRRLSTE